jgi:hypothetical protein
LLNIAFSISFNIKYMSKIYVAGHALGLILVYISKMFAEKTLEFITASGPRLDFV